MLHERVEALEIIRCVENLTGYEATRKDALKSIDVGSYFSSGGLGYSQFNELILMLGFDRVSQGFFLFVFGQDATVASFSEMSQKIDKFRQKAMLKYGGFKFAYKFLSEKKIDDITNELSEITSKPVQQFKKRRDPLTDIDKIPSKDTYLLGYIVDDEIKKMEQLGEDKEKLKEQKQYVRDIRSKGKRNHDIYLAYDYIDVYVATSMRERWEYWNVSRFIEELSNHKTLKEMNLRWFDPTQAYCQNRLDKGLAEGLILKRAACTIYLSQESDTFGKDSELATTLAQGKPVIAYIPSFGDFEEFNRDVDELIEDIYEGRKDNKIAMNFLRLYDPNAAWTDVTVKKWVEKPQSISFDDIVRRIFDSAQKMYEKRAKTLKEIHPLGLQINLDTGVANGVLVVRKMDECAQILRKVLLRELEFYIEEPKLSDDGKTTVLREKITRSVYRVVTGDVHLTNCFWNFYARDLPAEP